jgi:hypothetical protein
MVASSVGSARESQLLAAASSERRSFKTLSLIEKGKLIA